MLRLIPLCLLVALLAAPGKARAFQDVTPEQLQGVMPAAERFAEKEGEPPVRRAYRIDPATGEDTLVGYVFRTSDVPPDVIGYNSSIDVLVGMDLEGKLTGVEILAHRESLRRTRGEFFAVRGFQEQFAGKHIGDRFSPRRDVDNISGATISVDAMARGVRTAARRVAGVYLAEAGGGEEADGVARLEALEREFWVNLVADGPVHRLGVDLRGSLSLDLYLIDLWRDEVGEILLGPERYRDALDELGERAGDHLLVLGVDGPVFRFRPVLLSLVQGPDKLEVDGDDLALFPDPEGKMGGEVGSAGLWAIDERIDPSRPFSVAYGGQGGLDLHAVVLPGGTAVADAGAAEDSADGENAVTADRGAGVGDVDRTAVEASERSGSEEDEEPVVADAADIDSLSPQGAEEGGEAAAEEAPTERREPSAPPSFFEGEEESRLARTLERTSWARVGGILLLLALATAAFASKRRPLRWVVLALTFGYLGFVDGGFLSVSHITSAIEVGPGVFLNDIALLAMVAFTVVTTLLWGRVFCGFLCPFGALQDFLEVIVPRRFRREMPRWLHERARLVKYGVLTLILLPPALGAAAPALVEDPPILYQYVEPFGTVFFLSPSPLLWVLAVGFLLASAVVPRFYCRYVCPLGAALAVGSRAAPFRIHRVEQCEVCKVCEGSCPTRAIRGPEVDFGECVRCNDCEVKLIEEAGACRHDMDEIRGRLVQLQIPSR